MNLFLRAYVLGQSENNILSYCCRDNVSWNFNHATGESFQPATTDEASEHISDLNMQSFNELDLSYTDWLALKYTER